MPSDLRHYAFSSRGAASAYLATYIGVPVSFLLTGTLINPLSPSILLRFLAFVPAVLVAVTNLVLFRQAARAGGASPSPLSWLSADGLRAWNAASERRSEG